MRLRPHFRGFWVSGDCQGKVKSPKNEHKGSFSGGVVVTMERSNPQEQAFALVFGGCGLWWSQGKVKPPENEPLCSFSRVVSCGVWWVRSEEAGRSHQCVMTRQHVVVCCWCRDMVRLWGCRCGS